MENNDFLMGADPEFVFVHPDGQLEPAYNVFHRGNRAEGHNAANNGSEIGCDAHPEVAEMRPKPGTPEQLVNNINAIMKKHRNVVPKDVRWVAGSFVEGEPLGAHIHFDTPFREYYGDVLDGVLAQFTSPLEDVAEARARRGSHYGQLYCMDTDAVRSPTRTRFEYRTLGSFIVNPTISLGIFALAKAIMWEELNDGKYRIRRLKKGSHYDVIKPDMDKWRKVSRDYYLSKIPDLWKLITRYSYWLTAEGRGYWRYVCGIKNLALSKPSWHNGQDMLRRWKVCKDDRMLTMPTYQPITVPTQFVNEETAWQTIWTNEVQAEVQRIQQQQIRQRLNEVAQTIRAPTATRMRFITTDANTIGIDPIWRTQDDDLL